jgi:hypothetical protein
MPAIATMSRTWFIVAAADLGTRCRVEPVLRSAETGGRLQQVSRMPHEFSDYCNADGARRLKQRIEEFWRERGFFLNVKLVEAGFAPAMRSARTDVRSDMLNGQPRRKAIPEDRGFASASR